MYTFSYAFPLYFALSWEFTNSNGSRKGVALSLIILNLIVALSYPVLTLPYFFILEVLVIVLLHSEGENTRIRMLVKTSLVWFGYILVCLPVLYGLYKYVPFSHRTYVYEAVSLVEFLKNLYNGFIGASLTTMALIPLAGAIAIAGKSARVRRSLIIICVVVLLYAVFSSGLKVIFRGTLLEKMDLGHITTVFPIVMVMAAFVAIDTVIKDWKLIRRFLTGEIIGAVFAAFAIFSTKTIETQGIQYLILNVGSGIFISLMVIMTREKEAFSFPKLARNPVVAFLFSCAAVAAIFYFSPKKLATIDLISIAPVLIVATGTLFWICGRIYSIPKTTGTKLNWVLIAAIAIVLFFQVRFTRFFGEESIPYVSVLPELSVLEKLRAEELNNPFRIASIDLVYIPIVLHSGFEAPDARGPLFNKYYREFIGILRAPQLEDFIVRHDFQRNWYNLFISDSYAGFYLYPFAFLNIKYFVLTIDKSGTKHSNDFTVIYTGTTTDDYIGIWKGLFKLYSKPISVIRCNAAFDRWHLVKKTYILESDADVSVAILKTEGEGLLDTVYYSRDSMPKDTSVELIKGELSASDKITPKHYSPDEIRLDVEVTTPAVLVISNNYDPHWRAYVDGQETLVLRANLAFQSIIIKDAGRHSVVLRYEDRVQKFMLVFIPIGMLIFSYFLTAGSRIFFRARK
ncbi:MAG: hypothetical protein HQL01_13165 [Nitrospirae bacterium]|nr:hypothetical protein [Nitrospirota bacterium]